MIIELFFDIETLPCSNQDVIAEIAASIKPPGNISKADTIAKWMDENYESALAEKIHKTGLDGTLGSICCMAWARGDGVIESTLATDSEAEAIHRFYAAIQPDDDIKIIGHYVHTFDLPFLYKRSVILGIAPPAPIRRAMQAKSWSECVADTKLMWEPDRNTHIGMDRICRAFGIDGKGDFDGSMVADTWPVDPQKVIEYCKSDVGKTRKIYKRLTFCE